MAGNWDSPLSVHTSDLYENNPHTHHPAQHINTRKESDNTHTPLIRRSGFKYPPDPPSSPHSTLGLNLFCHRDGGWPAEACVPPSTLLSRSTPPLLPLSSHLLSGEELGLRTLKAGPQEPSLCSGMVTDSVISPRVSRCYRKAFVPFCKHLCPKTPGGDESPCETPPPRERGDPHRAPGGRGKEPK